MILSDFNISLNKKKKTISTVQISILKNANDIVNSSKVCFNCNLQKIKSDENNLLFYYLQDYRKGNI